MPKKTVLFFSAFIVAINALAVYFPHSQLTLFMSPAPLYSWLRLSLAGFLLLAGFVAARHALLRALVAVIGFGLLAGGLYMIISPTLMGHLSYYILPLDIIIVIESGIMVAISALRAQPSEFRLWQLVWRRPLQLPALPLLQAMGRSELTATHFDVPPHSRHWSPRGV